MRESHERAIKGVGMHEYHLAKAVLDSVLERARSLKGLKGISLISLQIGTLKMVTPESFTKTFHELARGSICEAAMLSIRQVEGDSFIVENIEGEFDS
jgi:Zn finger protein HypA/HybF involved in hydrogenase expression